jgi:hypothetical protein
LQVLDVASHGSKVMVKVRHNLLVRPFHMAKHAVPALATDLLTVPFIVNSGGLAVPHGEGFTIMALFQGFNPIKSVDLRYGFLSCWKRNLLYM